MNSWEEWKKGVGGWLGEAAQDTDRWARMGMRAYDRHGIQRDLDRHYARLGRLLHPLLSEGGPGEELAGDARIRAEMGRIASLRAEMEETEREIEALRKRRERARKAAEAADAATGESFAAGGEDPTAAATDAATGESFATESTPPKGSNSPGEVD